MRHPSNVWQTKTHSQFHFELDQWMHLRHTKTNSRLKTSISVPHSPEADSPSGCTKHRCNQLSSDRGSDGGSVANRCSESSIRSWFLSVDTRLWSSFLIACCLEHVGFTLKDPTIAVQMMTSLKLLPCRPTRLIKGSTTSSNEAVMLSIDQPFTSIGVRKACPWNAGLGTSGASLCRNLKRCNSRQLESIYCSTSHQ